MNHGALWIIVIKFKVKLFPFWSLLLFATIFTKEELFPAKLSNNCHKYFWKALIRDAVPHCNDAQSLGGTKKGEGGGHTWSKANGSQSLQQPCVLLLQKSYIGLALTSHVLLMLQSDISSLIFNGQMLKVHICSNFSHLGKVWFSPKRKNPLDWLNDGRQDNTTDRLLGDTNENFDYKNCSS